MLTIFGQNNRYCDGISRRSFLKIGALGLGTGGLMLSDLYRAEALAGILRHPRQTAVGSHPGAELVSDHEYHLPQIHRSRDDIPAVAQATGAAPRYLGKSDA